MSPLTSYLALSPGITITERPSQLLASAVDVDDRKTWAAYLESGLSAASKRQWLPQGCHGVWHHYVHPVEPQQAVTLDRHLGAWEPEMQTSQANINAAVTGRSMFSIL